MKVKILNSDQIREGVPIEVIIQNSAGDPQIQVEQLGTVPVIPTKNGHMGKFWTPREGNYKVTVRDRSSVWETVLAVNKQDYIQFRHEFSFFLIGLVFAALGVYIWMKKLNNKSA